MSNQAQLQRFMGEWLPRLDEEMRAALQQQNSQAGETVPAAHYGMLHYHMGWVDESFAPHLSPSGKRLRPMLCLIACEEVGGDPVTALPAAAAIELLHNFSLIHDDIEDGDKVRRHRPTLWSIWGVPQAINAGDAMFAMAFGAMQRTANRGADAQTTLAALQLFTRTCIELTEGQHLDMGFEQRDRVSVDEYMRMIRGKTAALIGASIAIGALIGGADEAVSEDLRRFGRAIGLAFQIQDDILGIWGDPAVTGKAAGNDILRRKKSLPLLHALEHSIAGPQLRGLIGHENFGSDHLPEVMDLLQQAGARAFAEGMLVAQHEEGIAALKRALQNRASSSALLALADGLLHRQA